MTEKIKDVNMKPTTSNKTTKSTKGTNTSSKSKTSKTKPEQAKNTPKKLTLTNINKLSSKFNEKNKVYLNIGGEEYEVLVSNKFRRTEIQKVVVDYFKFLHALSSDGKIDEDTLLGADIVADVLILKHFTNLPIPKDTENPAKLYTIAKNLVDLGIVEELLGGGKNSISKANLDLVKKQIEKSSENMNKVLGELGLKTELNKLEENRIDVDDYFSELEMRNFEISDDEDLELLVKVIDQLNDDGLYQEYMERLSPEEIGKLNERLDKLQGMEVS